jgi:uncharacterized protein
MARKYSRSQWLGALLLIGAAAPLAIGPVWSQNFGPPRGGFFEWFGAPKRAPSARPQAPADYSRAPAPTRKSADDPAPESTILVLGDAMADWLAYGLEDVLEETNDLGVIRKHRTVSGLLRYDPRHDDQSWASVAREAIAAEKPSFVVMMVGLHDRQQIREVVIPSAPQKGARGSTPAATPSQDSDAARQDDDQEQDRPAKPAKPAQSAAQKQQPQRITYIYEFRSEKWSEAYAKRIDETIDALKASGTPVFWIGLPSIRGARSTSDMVYLNELFRARAEKAGVVFVDVWDGFVDENGRYVTQGADVDGQIRRLRSSDGVYFTKSGARKLAHYVEREIRRFAARGPVAVALPTSEPQPHSPSANPGGPQTRPLAGPVMPLTATANASENGLLGGANATPLSDHVTVSRVLVKGEAVKSPAGRGDDFAWPRRDVAPFGSDPVVATTTLPIPVMQAAPAKTVLAPNADAPPPVAAPPRRVARPQPPPQQPAFRPFFFPFFGR